MTDIFDRLTAMETLGTPAEKIAAKIWRDVTDRRGWRQAADQFDDDIKHEILDQWVQLANEVTA
jgi:hypothetical protein